MTSTLVYSIKGMTKQIQKIYFDFDGVLAISRSGGQAVAEKLGAILKTPGADVNKAFQESGKPFLLGQQSVDGFLKTLSKSLDKAVKLEQLKNAYTQVPINEPLVELIKELKEDHSVELVSNNSLLRFETLKEKQIIDVWKVFDKVHISAQLGKFKNEFLPEGDPENSLLIDNNPEFLAEVAKKGAKTIYYDATKHDIDYLRQQLGTILRR